MNPTYLDLDPQPWVSWGVRYDRQLNPSVYFEPREGYSQNRADYL